MFHCPPAGTKSSLMLTEAKCQEMVFSKKCLLAKFSCLAANDCREVAHRVAVGKAREKCSQKFRNPAGQAWQKMFLNHIFLD